MSRFVSLIFLILLLSMGWTLAWYYAASRIDTEIKTFLEATNNQPEQLACGRLDVAGFPFRFDISCTDARFTQGDLNINVPDITATILVYRPTHVLIFATGPATFLDTFTGSSRELRWNDLRASARTNGWALARLSIEANEIELYDTLIGEKLVARIGAVQAHLLDIPEAYDEDTRLAELSLLARIDQADIPDLDIENAETVLEARIESIPDDVRQITAATIAKNWFEADTGVEITRFEGSDDKSRFEMNGRFSTTEQARLTGNFGLDTKNIADRLLSVVDPLLLQIIFGFPDDTGDYSQSFSLRHGVLMAGNLPVLTLPPLQ